MDRDLKEKINDNFDKYKEVPQIVKDKKEEAFNFIKNQEKESRIYKKLHINKKSVIVAASVLIGGLGITKVDIKSTYNNQINSNYSSDQATIQEPKEQTVNEVSSESSGLKLNIVDIIKNDSLSIKFKLTFNNEITQKEFEKLLKDNKNILNSFSILDTKDEIHSGINENNKSINLIKSAKENIDTSKSSKNEIYFNFIATLEDEDMLNNNNLELKIDSLLNIKGTWRFKINS